MLWYRYRQVPGRQYRLPLADSKEAHVSKELTYGKDGPQCRRYGFSCVEWLCAGRTCWLEDMPVSDAPPSSKLSRVAMMRVS